MLGASALGRRRGMVCGGRREEGSGWGTHVYLWRIHFDIWQNQYNIVKFKNKIKLKKKKKEYWSKLPFPISGDLPNRGIEPMFLGSPVLAGGFFMTSATLEALAAAECHTKF